MYCNKKHEQPYFFEGENELYFEEFYDARFNGYSPRAPIATSSKRNFGPKLGQGLSNVSYVPTIKMKCLVANAMCGQNQTFVKQMKIDMVVRIRENPKRYQLQ